MVATFVNEFDGAELFVQIGNGAQPEVFATCISINMQRSREIKTDAKTSIIMRTDDPTMPGKTRRRVASTDTSISGSGQYDLGDGLTLWEWAASGAPKNCIVTDPATGLKTTGPYVCTSFKETGQPHESATCDITLEQADLVVASAV